MSILTSRPCVWRVGVCCVCVLCFLLGLRSRVGGGQRRSTCWRLLRYAVSIPCTNTQHNTGDACDNITPHRNIEHSEVAAASSSLSSSSHLPRNESNWLTRKIVRLGRNGTADTHTHVETHIRALRPCVPFIILMRVFVRLVCHRRHRCHCRHRRRRRQTDGLFSTSACAAAVLGYTRALERIPHSGGGPGRVSKNGRTFLLSGTRVRVQFEQFVVRKCVFLSV